MYLGVTYHNASVFDPAKNMDELKKKLDTASPLLQPHHKFHVITSFICPTLIYQFQTTPLNKICTKYLSDTEINSPRMCAICPTWLPTAPPAPLTTTVSPGFGWHNSLKPNSQGIMNHHTYPDVLLESRLATYTTKFSGIFSNTSRLTVSSADPKLIMTTNGEFPSSSLKKNTNN
ncbi:hypothetical protein C0J52_25184 [Blattella germanica]|nr:hypothetical protein C0J52_25184 [Blattella germanica]